MTDWLKHVPDEELIYLGEGVLSGLAEAVREYKAARLHFAANQGEAAKVRYSEAYKFIRERLDMNDAYSAELRRRGLK